MILQKWNTQNGIIFLYMLHLVPLIRVNFTQNLSETVQTLRLELVVIKRSLLCAGLRKPLLKKRKPVRHFQVNVLSIFAGDAS